MNRTLVILDFTGGCLKKSSLSVVSFALKVGAPFDILLAGHGVATEAESVSRLGADCVLIADDIALVHPLADTYAQVIVETARLRRVSLVAAATSTFSKDVLPRAAAILDAPMVSDVVSVDPSGAFQRTMHAGTILATVELSAEIKLATVRSSSFGPPSPVEKVSLVEVLPVGPLARSSLSTFVSFEQRTDSRPDATDARVVVTGGRAIKTAADFERLVGGVADSVGGAIGCSRALVDLGIASNSLQIGQTGKTVAPELYLGIGVSGAIQHIAGMRDSRVIAVINSDVAAPIFEIADVGLVADIYQAVPELIQKLKK